MDDIEILLIILFVVCTYLGIKWSLGYVGGRWPALAAENKKWQRIVVSVLLGLVAGYFIFGKMILQGILKLWEFLNNLFN